jgi:hypothetical protein
MMLVGTWRDRECMHALAPRGELYIMKTDCSVIKGPLFPPVTMWGSFTEGAILRPLRQGVGWHRLAGGPPGEGLSWPRTEQYLLWPGSSREVGGTRGEARSPDAPRL